MRFDELDLEEAVLDGLDAMNFLETTPVQELTIPVILEGKDIIACAQTGTGKTAAYVLPVINELSKGLHPANAINAIIMAPTRELAQQIDQQIEGFTYFVPVSAVAVYGGTDGIAWEQQKRGMEMGADIVIATPGRLLSHIKLGTVDLSQVSFFVLDEADRMLDMGFYDDIMQVYKLLPATCQTIMFSATMPPKIRTLAQTILKNPEEVKIAISRPPETIMQTAYVCYDMQKLRILEDLFSKSRPQRVIIFSSSKMKVKELASTLKRMKFNVAAMHSDLEQSQREEVMKEFKNGRIDILVATDVVSRGIDINDIKLVINFDIPHDPEDYVHRIGRTARGTNGEGLAITFISTEEQSNSNASKNSWIRKSIKYRSIPNSAKHLYTSPKNTPTCVVAEDAPAKTAEKGKATTAPAAATTNAAEEDRGRKHRLTFINMSTGIYTNAGRRL